MDRMCAPRCLPIKLKIFACKHSIKRKIVLKYSQTYSEPSESFRRSRVWARCRNNVRAIWEYGVYTQLCIDTLFLCSMAGELGESLNGIHLGPLCLLWTVFHRTMHIRIKSWTKFTEPPRAIRRVAACIKYAHTNHGYWTSIPPLNYYCIFDSSCVRVVLFGSAFWQTGARFSIMCALPQPAEFSIESTMADIRGCLYSSNRVEV